MTGAAIETAPEGAAYSIRDLLRRNIQELRETLELLVPEFHVRPTADRVLVMCMPDSQHTTAAGLITNVLEEKPIWRAVVLQVGAKVSDVKPDDAVVMDAYVGQFVPSTSAKAAGVDLRLVKEADLLAILAP